MKSLVKKILEIDRNNVVVYCVYAQTLLRLESYQVVVQQKHGFVFKLNSLTKFFCKKMKFQDRSKFSKLNNMIFDIA